MRRKHVAGEQFNPEVRIELEKSPEHILLVPASPFPQPCGWVFEAGKDVVKVHDNTGRQRRQNVGKERLDIASRFRHVAGVDKENIV